MVKYSSFVGLFRFMPLFVRLVCSLNSISLIIPLYFVYAFRWIFFNLPNPSSRTLALGSTQPLTKMSTRNFPGGKKRPARRADNLAAIYEPNVWKLWEPQPLTTLRASTACIGIAFIQGRSFFSLFSGFQTSSPTHLSRFSWNWCRMVPRFNPHVIL
jgi:hypothetical protein